jgi:hypothetical protein
VVVLTLCVVVVMLCLLGSFSRSAIDNLSTKHHKTLGMTCGTSDADALSTLHHGECR